MNKLLSVILLILAGWGKSHAQDITPILKAIEQNNLQLRSAREGYAADIAEREISNTLLGPTSIEYSPFFHKGVRGLASSELIVSQEFEYPTLYHDRKDGINLQRNVNDHLLRTLRRDILFSATTLCHDLDYAYRRAALIARRTAVTDSILNIYERRLNLGHATIIDVQRIKIDRMNLSTEASVVQEDISRIHSALKTLNGGDLIPYLSTLDSLYHSNAMNTGHTELFPIAHAAMSDIPLVSDYETLETQTAEAVVRASQHQEKLSRKSWLPTFTVGYRRNTDLHEANGGFLVGVAFPLATNTRKQRAAHLQRTTAEIQLAEARSTAASRFESLVNEALNLQSTLKTYDVEMLNATLRTLYRAVTEGEIPVTDYFSQVETVYAILQQRLSTEQQLTNVIAEIHREEI